MKHQNVSQLGCALIGLLWPHPTTVLMPKDALVVSAETGEGRQFVEHLKQWFDRIGRTCRL